MDALLEIGLSNALVAGALALLAGVSRVFHRPAFTHSLWLLVLLKLITPPFFAIPVSWPAREEIALPDTLSPIDTSETDTSVNPGRWATIDEPVDAPRVTSAPVPDESEQ